MVLLTGLFPLRTVSKSRVWLIIDQVWRKKPICDFDRSYRCRRTIIDGFYLLRTWCNNCWALLTRGKNCTPCVLWAIFLIGINLQNTGGSHMLSLVLLFFFLSKIAGYFFMLNFASIRALLSQKPIFSIRDNTQSWTRKLLGLDSTPCADQYKKRQGKPDIASRYKQIAYSLVWADWSNNRTFIYGILRAYPSWEDVYYVPFRIGSPSSVLTWSGLSSFTKVLDLVRIQNAHN